MVDILVGVPDLEEEAVYVPAIESLGVPLRSRDSRHRYFRPGADEPRIVHVHAAQAAGGWVVQHLLFRDYLRAFADVRDRYATLKEDLADRYRNDRLAYTDAKAGFILDTLDAAQQWAAATGWELPPD